MKDSCDFQDIEAKWQKIWDERRVFEVKEDPGKAKYYLLEMYPYPSGRIHMGHVRNYSIGDVIARFKIMKGFNVLHPIGWDALGMPAENAAIKHGIHPQNWTLDNIGHMKSQLKKMGFSYDWSREVNTCLPEYYRWNQWLFLKMFEQGLAFRKKSWVNWCPQCRTVLANEQAVGDQCWRCSSQVDQTEMEHWFLKITAYAHQLLTGHAELRKWPEHVLAMQRNWIGESAGAFISFPVEGSDKAIEVFTTRVDTIYGATFLLLSPEHPQCAELISDAVGKERFDEWIERSVREQRLKRRAGDLEKEGADTGKRALNPFSGEMIPVWIANYVLMDYGTGAIMAVPAHDQRDYEFAVKYELPIVQVVAPEKGSGEEVPEGRAFESYGRVVNSESFDGLRTEEAVKAMAVYAEERGFGRAGTVFRIRDWGISRQRYWGTPIPIIHCPACGIVPVPYRELPVVLPYDVKFTGEEGSPLDRAQAFVETTCPQCGGKARRETDTMDTFFDSSWYFFRYASPKEVRLPFKPEAASYWLPVDLYIGGVEHAILHLIYSRFFTKVIRDLGYTSISEPFPHYLAQGMVTKDGSAMSKSRGNVVDPDDMIRDYGVDALRLFILFAAPPEREFAWAEEGIEGCSRFLNRVWTFVEENKDVFREESGARAEDVRSESAQFILKKMHQTIRKVGDDIGKRFHLNTAISSLMEFFNVLKKERDGLRESAEGRSLLGQSIENLIRLLSPFTPHLSEEMWERTGHKTILVHGPWPAFDEALAKEETVTVIVQVNGKLRDKFNVAAGLSEDLMKEEALRLEKIRTLVGGLEIRNIVCIPDKLVNIVL